MTRRLQLLVDAANAALIVLAGFHVGRLLRQIVRAPEDAAVMVGGLTAAAGVCILAAAYYWQEDRW